MTAKLLKQLQHELLLLVGLGQRGNAGLFQDGVLGQSRHGRRNICRPDVIFCTSQVLHLIVDDVACSLQPVDARTQRAAKAGDGLDGCVDGGQGGLGGRSRGQACGSDATSKRAAVAEAKAGVSGGRDDRVASFWRTSGAYTRDNRGEGYGGSSGQSSDGSIGNGTRSICHSSARTAVDGSGQIGEGGRGVGADQNVVRSSYRTCYERVDAC